MSLGSVIIKAVILYTCLYTLILSKDIPGYLETAFYPGMLQDQKVFLILGYRRIRILFRIKKERPKDQNMLVNVWNMKRYDRQETAYKSRSKSMTLACLVEFICYLVFSTLWRNTSLHAIMAPTMIITGWANHDLCKTMTSEWYFERQTKA